MSKIKLYISAICVLFASGNVSAAQSSTQIEENKSPLGFSFSTSYKRNFDYYSNALNSSAVGLSYQFNKDISLSARGGYDYVLSSHDSHPRKKIDWGVRDISLGADMAVGRVGAGSLNVYLINRIPTSRTSRLSSMRLGISPGAYWAIKMGRTSFTWDTSFTYTNYEFDTPNAKGTQTNVPISMTNAATLGYSMSDAISMSASGALSNLQNFKGRNIAVQSLGIGAAYKFKVMEKNASASLGYSWSDRIVSNNQLFDDDTSVFSVGLGFSL